MSSESITEIILDETDASPSAAGRCVVRIDALFAGKLATLQAQRDSLAAALRSALNGLETGYFTGELETKITAALASLVTPTPEAGK